MTGEKVLAFCIAVILVTGKLLLERQKIKDREGGIDIESTEYRYGRIMVRYMRRVIDRFKMDGKLTV